ncbi:MAG TPA: pyridoxine 5'-phosphate synthase [Desulfobacterales bacterium]|nr:pyridoxine 5'-phosphate synthase [Desulfobacterales bacterium]
MPRLAVNVDHVATLREVKRTNVPDPVAAAAMVELAGADGVVVHLREDRRHTQDRDVRILRETTKTALMLEMAANSAMIAVALEIKPDLVTLVPEKREELTTEGGVDLNLHKDAVSDAVQALQKGGIPVGVCVDADLDQIKLAHRIHVNCVKIHTGTFCEADTSIRRSEAFKRIVNSAKVAYKLKLGVNAGHGLGYQTIQAFAGLSEIDEFSIGHSIIARAVFLGLDRAVREMIALIKEL